MSDWCRAPRKFRRAADLVRERLPNRVALPPALAFSVKFTYMLSAAASPLLLREGDGGLWAGPEESEPGDVAGFLTKRSHRAERT